jgi:superfamily II DNA or RNA helicase
VDQAPAFEALPLGPALEMAPYLHQQGALAAWLASGRQGVVVLPTSAGKTYLAQLAMQATQQSTLIVVPTVDGPVTGSLQLRPIESWIIHIPPNLVVTP